ncbi:MAG: hypothetical protein Q8O76_03360 [Chloroflexota bacterium]|nr:hypothetical protein [Chloroflexota bacterium]
MPFIASVVLPLLGLLLSACALVAGPSPTPTPPLANPTPSSAARLPPALAVDKLGVELGSVARDQQGIQTFLVTNTGGRPLRAGPVSIRVEQGCPAAESAPGSPEVRPGEVAVLPIKLGPHRQLGPHRLTVDIPSNDPVRPRTTLSLRFDVKEGPPPSGPGPRLRVDKEMIDIGTVPWDWPLYEQFTMGNDGDAPLVLEGVPEVRVEEGC